MSGCPIHGVEWKTVPAGVSRSSGKPYNAFQACPVQGCTERPARAPRPNGQQSAFSGQPQASQGPSQSDRELVLIAACLHFAATLYAGTGASGVEDAKLLAADMYGSWKERAK